MDFIDFNVASGLIVSATVSVAIDIVSAVLALVGIGSMITMMFVDMYATEPLSDLLGEFIDKVVGPLTKNWQTQTSPTRIPEGREQWAWDSRHQWRKQDQRAVAVLYSQMSVYAGHGDKCLFFDESFHLISDKDAKEGDAVPITPGDLVRPALVFILMQERKPGKYCVHSLSLEGKPDEKTNPIGSILLEKDKVFSATRSGKLKSKSKADIIEAFTNGNKAYNALEVAF